MGETASERRSAWLARLNRHDITFLRLGILLPDIPTLDWGNSTFLQVRNDLREISQGPHPVFDLLKEKDLEREVSENEIERAFQRLEGLLKTYGGIIKGADLEADRHQRTLAELETQHDKIARRVETEEEEKWRGRKNLQHSMDALGMTTEEQEAYKHLKLYFPNGTNNPLLSAIAEKRNSNPAAAERVLGTIEGLLGTLNRFWT
jgi:hypothetical protein